MHAPRQAAPVVAFSSASPARPETAGPAQDVAVHVADRDARPLPGVALSMVDGVGAQAGVGTTGTTGEARLRAPGAGDYAVIASSDGYQTRVASCTVVDGPADLTVTLTRSSALHGAVRSESGGPRPGVGITLEQDGDTLLRADTDGDGAFRFSDLAAGHYRLVVAGGSAVAVHVPAEADVEQDVPAPVRS